jgi:hypothetical protein
MLTDALIKDVRKAIEGIEEEAKAYAILGQTTAEQDVFAALLTVRDTCTLQLVNKKIYKSELVYAIAVLSFAICAMQRNNQ